jgi:hypothetical protein
MQRVCESIRQVASKPDPDFPSPFRTDVGVGIIVVALLGSELESGPGFGGTAEPGPEGVAG